jgi:hypothetical protein
MSDSEEFIPPSEVNEALVDVIVCYMQTIHITEGICVEEYYNKFICTARVDPDIDEFNRVISLASTWRNEDSHWTSFKYKIISKHRLTKLGNIEQYLIKNIIGRITPIIRENIESILRGTVSELKNHIESQLIDDWTWENHGEVWHMDHIMPLKYYGGKDRSLLTFVNIIDRFHYKNYQPLAKQDNLIKGNGNCDKLIDFINRKKLKELPRHGEGNNNAMADPPVAPPAAPLAPLTAFEWIRANPPQPREEKAVYHQRYVENGGNLSHVSFCREVTKHGYISGHSGTVRYYKHPPPVVKKHDKKRK